ncbi:MULTISPECIES: Lrp/AsnC family transcriptional regulator [Microbacterium]|uniref:Lrp/AsnC family transcriptional regulator n=1 Tax=Microbacterium resistens TaxID=156977 RepID=A0ABY3RTF1_9MICO|nr:Lrp/AsnC family transcriptional regulator [Microbacterium resistens]MBW1640856.1 Lrp/AsnC family transcriptional regulator [Microbacterium resistens]MDA4893320.1 Lrp/AsnC family transcriptional regulator [Streptomyces sp. MS2A]UGS26175.1 Lrp/AsnC family transcriptional regulator [Microbacterium resistens]
MDDKPRTPVLDDISKRIIELLQEDGRRPYAEIGRAVGLSEAAARQRVQRLVEAGVMQIVAVTDPRQLGFSSMAMLGVRVSGDPRVVAEAIAAIPEIAYVVVTLGSFDILAEAICESDEDLLDLIATRVRAIEGVSSTESFLYAGLHKDLYNWGTR